jgi:hypothetical protein
MGALAVVLLPRSFVALLCFRYENIRRQQAAKVKESHKRSLQLLKFQERPFSFYGKALAKEEAAKQYKPPTAKDFQKPFKANPIPKSSLEVWALLT